MIERKELWTGIEVEHTKFRGLKTLFFKSQAVFNEWYIAGEERVSLDTNVQHIFIPIGVEQLDSSTATYIEWMIANRWKFTIEVLPNRPVPDLQLVHLRETYPLHICVLFDIVLDRPEAGGWAVKIEPPTPFVNRLFETGVVTLDCEKFFKEGYTPWESYEKDKDV